jgi:hypothetical protein
MMAAKKNTAKDVEIQPWDRQPGESSKAFEAFCLYRDMGTERSIRKVAQNLSKSTTLIRGWSSKYNWVERATLYDAELDRQAREKRQKEILEMRDRHAKLATQLLTKAAKGLLKLSDEDISANDVARLVEVGAKLERLSRGESTENVNQKTEGTVEAKLKGEVTIHPTEIDLSKLSDEELMQFEGLLEKLYSKSDV